MRFAGKKAKNCYTLSDASSRPITKLTSVSPDKVDCLPYTDLYHENAAALEDAASNKVKDVADERVSGHMMDEQMMMVKSKRAQADAPSSDSHHLDCSPEPLTNGIGHPYKSTASKFFQIPFATRTSSLKMASSPDRQWPSSAIVYSETSLFVANPC